MSRFTSHFQLPIPRVSDVGDWGQKINDWFESAESALGANVNLILPGSEDEGTAIRSRPAALASDGSLVAADPSDSRWGRVVLQATIVDGADVLGRLIGTTQIDTVPLSAEHGDTLYHARDAASITIDPSASTVVDVDGRLMFLPLGFAFDQGRQAFLNGILPLHACPMIPSGPAVQHKPGIADPSGSWVDTFGSGLVYKSFTFDNTSSTQHIDLVFPVVVPSEFGEWLEEDDDDHWGLRVRYRTGGAATLALQGLVDSAGTEHALGISGLQSGPFTDAVLRMKAIRDLGGTWTPGTTIYLRVRATGSVNTDTVDVARHAGCQFFPLIAWHV